MDRRISRGTTFIVIGGLVWCLYMSVQMSALGMRPNLHIYLRDSLLTFGATAILSEIFSPKPKWISAVIYAPISAILAVIRMAVTLKLQAATRAEPLDIAVLAIIGATWLIGGLAAFALMHLLESYFYGRKEANV